MPHFGLMDSDKMEPDQAALLRAKLHVRGGKRRISQGKIVSGICALHDALCSAIYRYFLSPHFKESLNLKDKNCDFNNDLILFLVLKKSGIINESFREEDFNYLSQILDQALEEKIVEFDMDLYFDKFNNLMEQLGVLPFNENELPPEDPETF